jgi:Uma2 family endonuclease
MIQFLVGEKIKAKLQKKKRGTIIVECSILTREGVKVADVAWASDEFMKEYKDHTPYKKAPEICVEILSPGNSHQEIESKIALYLEKGAQEVWILEKGKKQTVYTHSGILKDSVLVPGLKLR